MISVVYRKNIICLLTSLLCFIALPTNSHAADDYLDALEAEAEQSAALDSSTSNNSDLTASSQIKLSDQQKQQHKEFQQALLSQLPNTYKLYVRLNPEQRAIVVETYFTDGKTMAAATRQLFNLYFKE